MSLPKMDVPTYELELPTTGKKVKYRPFLVKEHKVLLMLQNSDMDGVNKLVGDLISACTNGKVDGHSLASVDAEYLFLNIRAKSIGERYEFIINCDCGNKIEAEANIDEIKIVRNPEHQNKILLTESIGVEMKYPDFGSVLKVYEKTETDVIFEMILNSVKAVYTPDSYTEIDSTNKEELREFLDGLTKDQFDKIENFFATMPNLIQEVDRDCPQCGKHNHVEIKGLDNFFI